MSRLYGIVDCARDPRLFDWVKAAPEHTCLFQGVLAPELERVSPHLVYITDEASVLGSWCDQLQTIEGGWGLLCRSSRQIDDLRRCLKKHLMVNLPDGKRVLFRFYDPLVWEVYWGSLSKAEKDYWLTFVDAIGTPSLVPTHS